MLYIGIAILLVLIVGVALLLKWMASGLSTRRNADSLTPEDLKVLEQSAVHLVDEIKETAAVAIRDLDDRCEELRKLLLLTDQRIALWSQIMSESEAPPLAPQVGDSDPKARVYAFSDAGLGSDDIARETGLPVGEVTLLLGLRSSARV